MASKLEGDSEDAVIVSLLHDVVEDSAEWTVDMLVEDFGQQVGDAVEAITKREGESYREYIERVRTNEIARRVKIRDIRDNLSETKKITPRVEKYFSALIWLEN